MYMEVHFLPSLRFIFSRASYLLPLFMPSDISEAALKPYLFNFYFRTKPWNPDGFLGLDCCAVKQCTSVYTA